MSFIDSKPPISSPHQGPPVENPALDKFTTGRKYLVCFIIFQLILTIIYVSVPLAMTTLYNRPELALYTKVTLLLIVLTPIVQILQMIRIWQLAKALQKPHPLIWVLYVLLPLVSIVSLIYFYRMVTKEIEKQRLQLPKKEIK